MSKFSNGESVAISCNQPSVELIDCMASDGDVIRAMLVSTLGAGAEGHKDGTFGRINFLMKNRHGSPFEHNMFKFLVTAPITVIREFQRHRIGFSYNEESGRYREMEPCFYAPGPARPLSQSGKPGEYVMSTGTAKQYADATLTMIEAYQQAYTYYQHLLEIGVAKEVARGVLPLNLMSSMYVTCNARSLMSFLSLRVDEPTATYPSKPMWEIDVPVAREMEKYFGINMPLTYKAFVENGRVAP